MDSWAQESIVPLLLPVQTAWQPHDYLPDPCAADFLDHVQDFRAQAAGMPDDFLVALVGDMVTEEALPSYMSMLNRMMGIRDESGAWNRHSEYNSIGHPGKGLLLIL